MNVKVRMKIVICMSALLMLAVSCKKDKKTEIENAGSGFRATVESYEGTGKTHLDGFAVKWNSGDAILVKSSACPTPKRFTTTGTDASANFVAAEPLDENFYTPNYTAYYPGFATNPAGVYFSGDQLTLPATQQYDENNTFASGANPMAAASSETLLPFKNVCGVLKLQLYSTTACQVRSISITSNTGQMLWGTGAVGFDAADDNDNPTLGTLSDGGSTLTLDCGTGVSLSLDEDNPTVFYFVVPPLTLTEGFTVKVTDTDGNVWTKTTAKNNHIVRSKVTVMPVQEVSFEESFPYVDLGLPSGLLWATCNLGAEHEYDYGDYYAWGATTTWYEAGYAQENPQYHWKSGYSEGYTWAYCPGNGGSDDYNETALNEWNATNLTNNVLNPEVDAAHANWGEPWRMPTTAEWQELASNTYMKWEYDYAGTGVAGFIVYKVKNAADKGHMTVDNNDNPEDPAWVTYDQNWNECDEPGGYSLSVVHLFLPAAGNRDGTSLYNAGSVGYYWSSSLYTDFPLGAYFMIFDSGNVIPQSGTYRYYGFSVRPVR